MKLLLYIIIFIIMRFLSFDIGIKNCSYSLCNFNEETKELVIEEWDIINLLKDELEKQQICSHVGKTKHKIKCKKFANFMIANGEEYFCKTHKKNYKKYIAPVIKKIKTDDKCCEDDCNKKAKYEVNGRINCPTHKAKVEKHFKTNYSLKKVKTIKCKDVSIDTVANKIYDTFDTDYKHFLDVDIVLLELQSSLNAPKMKSISNYMASYFKIKGQREQNRIKEIKYYKATNKLEFNVKNTDDNKECYRNRKKTGIENVNEYLDYKNDIENKEKFNNHKKKDDLADALLQVLSYLKMNKMF